MKKNKISKILSMLLVCVVTLGTTACEKKSDASSQSKTYKKEISKIVVATGDSSVPSSYVENGKHKGFEVDLWNAISEKTGLECGLLLDKMPGCEAISMGPDMFEVHTPNEHLSISSVKNVYEYLLEVLKAMN